MRGSAAFLGYALCTFVLCAALLWQAFPPCVDYPQHLAMAVQLRDALVGGGDGRLVLWTYNGLFELAAGLLALVLPIDVSGRVVLAAGLALTSLAVWRLVRFRGRPSGYAFAWLPLAYSSPFSWGFINFTLSAALATLPSVAARRWNAGQAAAFAVLGAASTANFLLSDRLGTEATEARAIIEAIPAGAKVAPVLELAPEAGINETLRADSGSEALIWAHFPAYAVAYRGAEIPWMFAREHGHFPVRLPIRDEPELPPVDYGWSRAFHPSADYAREFNHVLVLTGSRASTHSPKAHVFGEAAQHAVELDHQGRFWLFRYTPGAP